ncbi:MAG: ArgR family transcriptional regulator [Bacteroidetes bacterium GWF2_42_66]|nr:MAG: ArgR family transcriptional regulator [Bacteroidetes bacterium GWA2_42_15]OFX99395.1 MAG: ArgR family transcriptional regulator [Bacteroidetes bacterium GWE2_42_39]OFY40447.1 MAG: ArgR family transcriptional regulator [Bacteroidetes bacterium GWF2_42_66]HBL76932.1 ArgR family transcriptional regulator [Prolixibacteraceae bacterium]HCR91322.1 ArgR family transcriptional regulator [Prolixibacteraceae bacterium]
MKSRIERQIAIRKAILTEKVSSQDDLVRLLRNKGIEITQATLSRDLKTLKVAKAYDPAAGYIYVIPEAGNIVKEETEAGINYLTDGLRNLQFSGNLAVINTRPGYASSIAALIDTAAPYEIIGTIAGDDTVLLIIKEGIKRADLINSLILIMPKLAGKIK